MLGLPILNKSEIRISNSETNSNEKNSNDRNIKSKEGSRSVCSVCSVWSVWSIWSLWSRAETELFDRIYGIYWIVVFLSLWRSDFEENEISHCKRAMAIAASSFPEISLLISENDGSARTRHKTCILFIESFAKHYKCCYIVIPAKAGIHCFQLDIDSGSSPE